MTTLKQLGFHQKYHLNAFIHAAVRGQQRVTLQELCKCFHGQKRMVCIEELFC